MFITNEGANGTNAYYALTTQIPPQNPTFTSPQLWWTGTGMMYSGIKLASGCVDGDHEADLVFITNEGAYGSKGFLLRSTNTYVEYWWNGAGLGWGGITPFVGDADGDTKADLVFMTDEGANGTKFFESKSTTIGFATPQQWASVPGWIYAGVKAYLR
jgi:hypothetical protein